MTSLIQRLILSEIEESGRSLGAPSIEFPEKKIFMDGEDIYVAGGWFQRLTETSAFYLSLPRNAYGIVVFPDGTSHNMEGGLHESPPGLYKLLYVDKHERHDFTPPISEMTSDGEKLTLKLLIRYRVTDPLTALRIDRPVETFIEHIETDVAQYIRTHEHNDIADSAENRDDSKILSFFSQRHNRRFPLSKAFSIMGVELKDFVGDPTFLEMRRKAQMDERKNRIEMEQAEYQQELGRLRTQYRADNEKNIAEHTADMEKKAAEHKAEIEKREAEHKKEKDEILHQVRLREIELDDKRKHLQMRGDEFSQVIEAISRAFSSGVPMNPNVMKYITDLFAAYKEEMDDLQSPPLVGQKLSAGGNHAVPPTPASPIVSDKVEKLKNTLLNLLNPKK